MQRVPTLIDFGKHILDECVVELASSYKRYFPLVKYKAEQAVRKLLQMPVTIIQMTLNGPGSQRLYDLETLQGVDIPRVINMAEKCLQGKTCFQSGMSREVLKDLCTLASSESDRLLIKYACCKGQNLSKNKASNLYGFGDFHEHESRINSTLEEFKELRDAVDTLAKLQDKAVLEGFGLTYSDDDSAVDQLSSSEGTDCEWISDDEKNKGPDELQTASAAVVNLAVTNKSHDKSQQPRPAADPDVPLEKNRPLVSPVPSMDHLLLMLRDNTLNWFAFVAELRMLLRNYSEETLVYALTEFSDHLENMDLTDKEKNKVEMSRQAYLEYERQKAMGDDAWVSESVSDTIDPDSVVTADLNEQVKIQRQKIKRKEKRQLARLKAERRLLKRKVPKRVSQIVNKFPNIGKDIEEFVRSNKVGADAWRRTGVLTFDGNIKKGPKVTFQRIQKHLQEKYQTKISYGTVVQLCTVKNKHRISAKRYKGVGKITCRRSRKGFSVRMNPDGHWNNAVYQGLDKLQLKDGLDKVVLNRDDAAGFRLDTAYTHKQHKGVQLANEPDLTTGTDFVNSHPAQLQTSSYLFMETETTAKMCVGIVKPPVIYDKSPSQHMADLQMIKDKEELYSVFQLPDGSSKSAWCVRVDGAGDEGPGHKEVAFLWAEKHLMENHLGGSYLNAVELMNGCLAVAHSNLFIPSTLGGAVNTATGFDETQLIQNLDLASDVYISRVQGAPCGEAKIQLFKEACDEAAKALVDIRNLLLVYLSGKKEQKEELKKNNQKLHDHFESVSKVLQNHKQDLPPKYFLALSLCHKPECPHKRCQEGNKGTTYSWYKGGPLTTYFPLPVQDLSKPWGSECTKCKGRCSGHFLGPEEAYEKVQKGEGVVHLNPPSTVLQNAYNDGIKANRNLNQILEGAEDLAKKTCLSLDETKMWLKHLDDVRSRRQQGAQKAAATRAAKKGNRFKLKFLDVKQERY